MIDSTTHQSYAGGTDGIRDFDTASIPAALKERAQWVVWRLELRHPDQPEGPSNKMTKIPYMASEVKAGRHTKASSNKPETWGSLDEALEAYAADPTMSGLGFCFSEGDGLVGIDLDHCFDECRILLPWAKEIVVEFAGAYIEYSPSGDGLHIWSSGKAIKCGRRVISEARGVEEGVEIYDYRSPRYFTVTGKPYEV
jgi:primase-polymerase (primpol)-like protein